MTELERAICVLMIMANHSNEAKEFARKCDEENKGDKA